MSDNKTSASPPEIEFGWTDELPPELMRSAFLFSLAGEIRIMQRQHDGADAEVLKRLIASLASGNGTIVDLNSFFMNLTDIAGPGPRAAPPSLPISDYLKHFGNTEVKGLQQAARELCASFVPAVMKREIERQGYVSVFVEGAGIEVTGKRFGGAHKGYYGKHWLHCVFIGGLWASSRLCEGGVQVDKGWRKQLEQDVVPLLCTSDSVWVRTDISYYNREFVKYCDEKGWDYSVNVPHTKWADPVLEQVEGLPESAWTDLDTNGWERSVVLTHHPAQWHREHSYVVVRTLVENGQPLMFPHDSLILVSRDDLPVEDLVLRHRGKRRKKNSLKGLFQDLGLYDPPCSRLVPNRAFYACGQLAQVLLRAVQYHLL